VHNLAGALKADGKTILMVEHNIDELAKHADRIVVMDHGEILKDGPTREVLSDVDFLVGLGIYPPQVTQVAQQLIAMGYSGLLEGGQLPITVDEGLAYIKKLQA
jgi:energy-coupling factor transporter ATP-binding protein EcfA2